VELSLSKKSSSKKKRSRASTIKPTRKKSKKEKRSAAREQTTKRGASTGGARIDDDDDDDDDDDNDDDNDQADDDQDEEEDEDEEDKDEDEDNDEEEEDDDEEEEEESSRIYPAPGTVTDELVRKYNEMDDKAFKKLEEHLAVRITSMQSETLETKEKAVENFLIAALIFVAGVEGDENIKEFKERLKPVCVLEPHSIALIASGKPTAFLQARAAPIGDDPINSTTPTTFRQAMSSSSRNENQGGSTREKVIPMRKALDSYDTSLYVSEQSVEPVEHRDAQSGSGRQAEDRIGAYERDFSTFLFCLQMIALQACGGNTIAIFSMCGNKSGKMKIPIFKKELKKIFNTCFDIKCAAELKTITVQASLHFSVCEEGNSGDGKSSSPIRSLWYFAGALCRTTVASRESVFMKLIQIVNDTINTSKHPLAEGVKLCFSKEAARLIATGQVDKAGAYIKSAGITRLLALAPLAKDLTVAMQQLQVRNAYHTDFPQGTTLWSFPVEIISCDTIDEFFSEAERLLSPAGRTDFVFDKRTCQTFLERQVADYLISVEAKQRRLPTHGDGSVYIYIAYVGEKVVKQYAGSQTTKDDPYVTEVQRLALRERQGVGITDSFNRWARDVRKECLAKGIDPKSVKFTKLIFTMKVPEGTSSIVGDAYGATQLLEAQVIQFVKQFKNNINVLETTVGLKGVLSSQDAKKMGEF
jgi:hypothetical protein